MNVVDSSGWLEYFSGSKRAELFAEAIEDVDNLIIPSLTLIEVFKKISKERGENIAMKVIAHMQIGKVVDLDSRIALFAAKISLENSIPMADSIIYSTSHLFGALLWTQDNDFRNLSGVKFFDKKAKYRF